MRSRLRRMTTGKAIPTPYDVLGVGNAMPWFWLDGLDPTSWAQLSDGTLAATSLGDPVGFVRDKSGLGYNAIQSVSGARLTHGRMPRGGVRNQLTYTEDVTNAVWQVDAGITKTNATTVTETATNTKHGFYQTKIVLLGSTYTASVTLKKGVGLSAPDVMQLSMSSGGFGASNYANVNIVTGEVMLVSGGASCISAPDPNFPGSWRFSYTAVSQVAASSAVLQIYFCNNNATAARTPTYTGSVDADCQVLRSQAEFGPESTPYQKVVQGYDVTEAGVPSVPCLWLDGVDDFLDMTASGAAMLRNCSRFTIMAGATFTANITSSRGLFLASTASDSGSARLVLQGQAAGNLAVRGRRLDSDSIATANTPQNTFEAGVFAAVVSYETAVAELQRNGVVVAANNSFQTPGNTSDTNSAGVHVGRLSTAYFGGFIAGEVGVRNVTLTETQMRQLSNYFANAMGIAA